MTTTSPNTSTDNSTAPSHAASGVGSASRVRSAIIAAAAFAFTAVPALAQRDLTPPQPMSGDGKTPLLPMFIAAVCVAMVIAVNLIPSKRGHQD